MEKFKNKALAELISSMAKMDQLERSRVRQKQKLYSGLAKSDMARLRQMKRIVNKYGWTTRKLVGKRASHSAWLLVQHGDDDVKFQEYCLKLIKQAGENDEVARSEVAFLTDRILVNKGRPQIYGTQFYFNKNGESVPRPIFNLPRLDDRRKTMGLGSFDEYKIKIEKEWKNESGRFRQESPV